MKYYNFNTKIKNQFNRKIEQFENHKLWVKKLALILLTEIVDTGRGEEFSSSL